MRASATFSTPRQDSTKVAAGAVSTAQGVERRQRFPLLEVPPRIPQPGLKPPPVFELRIEAADRRAEAVRSVFGLPLRAVDVAQLGNQVDQVVHAAMVAVTGL